MTRRGGAERCLELSKLTVSADERRLPGWRSFNHECAAAL
jgi:hypothetical protein